MQIVQILFAALVFPGVSTALALGLALRVLRGRGAALPRSIGRSREELAALASMLLAGLGLALMPWRPGGTPTAWVGAWVFFELAFLVPLLPALFAGQPSVVRAAVRAAQLGALARAMLWVALAATLSDPTTWSIELIPMRLLALSAALIALLPVVGWGPFGNDPSITPSGIGRGLPEAAQLLLDSAQDVRCAALLAAILIAGLPTQIGPAWLGLVQVLAGLLVVVLSVRRLDGRLPRIPLNAALRLCWIVVAPLAVGAIVLVTIQL